MMILLIIAVIAAVIYIYAAVAYYQAFKNWNPVCNCTGNVCDVKHPKSAEKEVSQESTVSV